MSRTVGKDDSGPERDKKSGKADLSEFLSFDREG